MRARLDTETSSTVESMLPGACALTITGVVAVVAGLDAGSYTGTGCPYYRCRGASQAVVAVRVRRLHQGSKQHWTMPGVQSERGLLEQLAHSTPVSAKYR